MLARRRSIANAASTRLDADRPAIHPPVRPTRRSGVLPRSAPARRTQRQGPCEVRSFWPCPRPGWVVPEATIRSANIARPGLHAWSSDRVSSPPEGQPGDAVRPQALVGQMIGRDSETGSADWPASRDQACVSAPGVRREGARTAVLDHAPAVDHDDSVHTGGRRESVSDHDCSSPGLLAMTEDAAEELCRLFWIEHGLALVEDEKRALRSDRVGAAPAPHPVTALVRATRPVTRSQLRSVSHKRRGNPRSGPCSADSRQRRDTAAIRSSSCERQEQVPGVGVDGRQVVGQAGKRTKRKE
jgi:hypothetical protein